MTDPKVVKKGQERTLQRKEKKKKRNGWSNFLTKLFRPENFFFNCLSCKLTHTYTTSDSL